MTLSEADSRVSTATRRRSNRLQTGTAPRWVCARGLGVAVGVLLALFSTASVHAQVTFDAASSPSGTTSSTKSWSHTVTSSGSNRALIVGVVVQDGSSTSVNSITFNNVNLTEVGKKSYSSSVTTHLWRLVNPDTGTHTVTVTLNQAKKMITGAMSFTNVDQTTPVGTFFSESGTSSSISKNVTGVLDGELVVDVLGTKSSPTATVGASQTQRWNENYSGDLRTAASTEAGTGTVTMSWSLSESKEWALAAVALKPPRTAALTGTLSDGATEDQIVAGGETLIITLTSDTWDATIGADNSKTTDLINGLDSAQAEATGWDAVVKANLDYNDVTRTSDTVVTITLGAEAPYDVTANETVTVTVPATAVAGTGAIVATPTFTILPSTAALTGTLADGATEDQIVAGGETLIITLTNDTWDATIGADNSKTTDLINGLDSGGSEGTGWDAVVKANLDFGDVTRTSNTVVTITLGAEATYDVTASETITVTVPATAVAGTGAIVATPTDVHHPAQHRRPHRHGGRWGDRGPDRRRRRDADHHPDQRHLGCHDRRQQLEDDRPHQRPRLGAGGSHRLGRRRQGQPGFWRRHTDQQHRRDDHPRGRSHV